MFDESNDKIMSSFKTDLCNILKIEIDSIKFNISLQKHMKSRILSISDNLWNKIISASDIDLIHKISKDLYNISNFCFQLQTNINCLEKLETKLQTLETTNIVANDDFFNTLNKYREEYLELINNSTNFNSSFNNFITSFSEINYSDYNEQTKIIGKNNTNNTNDINNENNENKNNNENNENIENKEISKEVLDIPGNLKENTLVISNTKIILPFTKNDLEEKLKTSNLSSFREIINTFYKKSAKSFEPSAISRFKEAYSLIINKEHGSKFQAITLGLELSANYNLHPAIIAACKNLTELDVYLSCLEYNELSDFHFFDIVYNIPPVPKKHLFKKFVHDG